MEVNRKFLFILFVILCFGVFYSYREERLKIVDYEKEDINLPTNNLTDSVKLSIDGNLNIYYFDVGQADAILIENNEQYMLIDAGNNADGSKLVNYFKNMGIEKFNHVIATHAHEDHIGGMDEVINNFKVRNFYMPDVVTTTKTFEDLVVALEDNSVAFQTPEIGHVFLLEGCKFEVIYVGDEDDDLNDTSIVVRGLYGDTSFLFMGDATNEVEKKILNKNIDSDVLKVGHHGSRYSSSVNFINKVTPLYSIISAGEDNSYDHPHESTITKLVDRGSKIYRTDIDGTIIVTSDGTNIDIKTIETELDG